MIILCLCVEKILTSEPLMFDIAVTIATRLVSHGCGQETWVLMANVVSTEVILATRDSIAFDLYFKTAHSHKTVMHGLSNKAVFTWSVLFVYVKDVYVVCVRGDKY